MMNSYHEISGFESLYLEDSYVLGIDDSGEDVVFIMEFVLTEQHPKYSEPNNSESYCYIKGKIKFIKPKSVRWLNRSKNRFIDKNGEIDLGNIDTFILDGDKIMLNGDWGELEISPNQIIVEYE
ncbi:hypothetical protein G3485_13075 [Shewanella baltica]|uniref:hypothetical protein n=1 Tax=Shewanella baltica TaxID=62322 RepID=UPI00217E4049|nr:hypothetical protein [Shewanella baltica]MCS6127919.1 hypothetical protein [Shewanella baltica]MCS6139992.1 hypothetical protein [Shewanella baltica]MCS6146133.1 hypothetical protein [Shewanella baltica]MCS6170663.1 hypothetical protein [Shewanella baltica]MCS6177673.1 hypothetical protein [Shewanella baltica]